jgi:hypothetical protein
VSVYKEKSKKVIPFLFPVMEQTSILPLLVTRVADELFTGSQGDTVSFRLGELRAVARKYRWRDRQEPIVTDDITGGETADIKFGTHTYSATGLTDEHMKMDEVNLATEVVGPQAEAVASDLEYDIRDAFNSMRPKVVLTFNPTDDPYDFAVDAQAELSGFKVAPNDAGRFWLVGANVAKVIKKSDRITRYDSAGDSNSLALRRGTIGDLAGLRVVESLDIDANASIVAHRTGLLLGTVAPEIPPTSAVSGARLRSKGFALRHIIDYDSAYLSLRSVVSCFSGLTPVYDERKGGTGRDAMDLKVLGNGELPVSVRFLGVNFNNTHANGLGL